jgi:uncharacterized membrane protein YccC
LPKLPSSINQKADEKMKRWSRAGAFKTSQAIAAMLGLAGPIAVGTITGHPQIGMAVSLGGLALSVGGQGETFSEQVPGFIYALIAGSIAVFAGTVLAGHNILKVFVIPAVAAVAVLVGGISRPLARATTLFILFMIIAANLGAPETNPLGMMLLFSLGAVWTAGLSLVLRSLFRAMWPTPLLNAGESMAQPSKYSAKQLLRRWWKLLTHLSGWQYVLRITICLIAAQVFEWIWPQHHGYWVSITVVIVLQRDLQKALSRALQRVIGTVLGVLLISLIFLGAPPLWVIIVLIALLAAARPILREANYTAYAAVITPLVILLLDFGQQTSWAPIVDRLIATLVGCALTLTLGYLIWLKLLPQERVTVNAKFRGGMRQRNNKT